MITLVADGDWKKQLEQIPRIAEIRDSEGRFLGYFRPAVSLCDEDVVYAEAMDHFDPERFAAMKAADDGRPGVTTAELFDRLNRMEVEACASR